MMSVDNLSANIVESPKFRKTYLSLLKKSVSSQIPALISTNDSGDIEWAYLISCASLLFGSSDGSVLDIAYRICQAAICEPTLPSEYKNAAAGIFALSANNAAITLSVSRALLVPDFNEYLPLQANIDIAKKQFSNSIIDNDEIFVLNEFQKEVYTSFQDNDAISISAPTSAGKSFVLLHLLSNFILETHNPKIIYIVPTRALIQQVEMDIRQHLKDSNISATVTSVPVLPSDFNQSSCVFVFTQERLQWVLSEHTDINFDLVIVDEAHKISDNSRGILLSQVLQKVSYMGNCKFIFASPMSENPGALFRTIKPTYTKQEIVSEIVTVNQNLIWISKDGPSTTKWRVELLAEKEKIQLGYVVTERITKTSMRLPILAYRISAGQTGNLLYVNCASEAERVSIQLKSLILNDKPGYQPSTRVCELIKLVKKTVHPDYALIEVLKAGVAFHYGNMPLAIRNEIENLFKRGDISFLVCTSTLIEGVNLPAKSIFIRGPKKGSRTPMNEMDFWNLAGRAGRQGKEFQGNIFCLDAEDITVWKTGTPNTRKKYRIESTLDYITTSKRDELLSFIISKRSHSQDAELDYAYTYFLETYSKYNGISNSFMPGLYGVEFCAKVDTAIKDALSNISLPLTLLSKNPGVNPFAQQQLLTYFERENKPVDELIPPYPENDDAQERYMHIIGHISNYLSGDTYRLNAYRSVLITNWLRGYSLARIISKNIEWNRRQDTGKSLASIIRDTMRDIEEYARFRFLKYTTCYIDILKFYLENNGNLEAAEKMPQLNLWLEFGSSQKTQISLMSLGFTRTAAIELSDFMVREDLEREQCLQWLQSNNLHSLELPQAIIEEATRIIELQ